MFAIISCKQNPAETVEHKELVAAHKTMETAHKTMTTEHEAMTDNHEQMIASHKAIDNDSLYLTIEKQHNALLYRHQ